MKVLILTPEMRIGGTCRDAVEWANRLADCGDDVVVIAQSATGEGVARLSSAVKIEGLGGGRAVLCAGRLLRLLRKHPDATILANAGTLAGLAIIFRSLGLIGHRVVFVDPFNPADTFRRGWKTAAIYRCLLWRTDAFVHLSDHAERFHRRIGLGKEKSFCVPNISSRPDEIRTASHPAGALRCVAVGRLDKIKGFDRLIGAFGKIATRWPGATLRIVGEGYDRSRLEDAIRRAGLGDRVTLVGHSDSVRAELRAADLFILPSLYEGMPNTLVEALDEGLRVVATPCKGSVRSLMRRLGASEMVIREGDFTESLLRAVETALSLEATVWAEIHRRHREIFDNERNFRQLRTLLTR
ncbi:MAG: glycosyltransferase [Opitutales bacterium]|jgi:glycosyltransferase involved in cell wall biosynthesis